MATQALQVLALLRGWPPGLPLLLALQVPSPQALRACLRPLQPPLLPPLLLQRRWRLTRSVSYLAAALLRSSSRCRSRSPARRWCYLHRSRPAHWDRLSVCLVRWDRVS